MGGAGPIPLSEVLAYCRMFGIDDMDDRYELVALLRVADSEYLGMNAERRGDPD